MLQKLFILFEQFDCRVRALLGGHPSIYGPPGLSHLKLTNLYQFFYYLFPLFYSEKFIYFWKDLFVILMRCMASFVWFIKFQLWPTKK
jgi:hypothetical protein